MRLIAAYAQLLRMGQPVFTTADAAAHLGIPNDAASSMLARLASATHLTRVRRGLWAVSGRAVSHQLAHRLTAPAPGYISLQTALFHHGIVSQIPEITYVVSPARTQRIITPFGVFSIHHVQPKFFFGYKVLSDGVTRMATPEKALADYLYLGPAKSGLFRSLPDLELPPAFGIAKTRGIIRKIPSVRRRSHALRSFEELLHPRGFRSAQQG